MRRSSGLRTRRGPWRKLALLVALLLPAACAPFSRGPTPDATPPRVRVGVVVDSARATVAATIRAILSDPATGRVLFRTDRGDTVTITRVPDGPLLLEVGPDRLTVRDSVAVRPDLDGMLIIDGRPYRGTAIVRAARPATVTVVNVVDMESYLLGVVPFEIGRVGPELLEASKAQSVAARTYAIRYLGRRDSLGFDVFATVDDQVYGGAEGEHEPISIAVRETRGEILTFGGEAIEAFYHSTCGGVTAAIEEVWPEPPRPYLRSVVDIDPATGLAFDSTSSRFRWTQTWSAEELRAILDRTMADSLPAGNASGVGELLDFEILERTPSDRIRRMRVSTEAGTFFLGGDRIRWIFLTPSGSILNSSRFTVRVERGAGGEISEITAEGMGWGHGIGMCQVGAMGRARAGQNYRDILEAYYGGTRLTRLY
jgi:stage II sporulation protein D